MGETGGRKIAGYLGGAVILGVLPLLIGSNYWIGAVNLALIYSIAVLGLNIILGLTGQLNLAQAAFWGIGAYTAALLNTRMEWPFWATFIAAPIVAALFGVLLGFPTLRLAGRYLALATLPWSRTTGRNLPVESMVSPAFRPP